MDLIRRRQTGVVCRPKEERVRKEGTERCSTVYLANFFRGQLHTHRSRKTFDVIDSLDADNGKDVGGLMEEIC